LPSKRTYGDRCGVARALDLVGERWALLVVRELILGPKRFTDLRAGLPNMGPDVLAQRLRDLETTGVLRRTKAPSARGHPGLRAHGLGARARAGRPRARRLGQPRAVPLRRGAARRRLRHLALKTLFDPAAAGSLDEEVEIRLAGEPFHARVSARGVHRRPRPSAAPVAVIDTDPGTLARVLWHGRQIAGAIRSGDLRIEGDRAAGRRFLALFPRAAAGRSAA
jgi:DNA-binding HxlR family transcriptional regulator